MLSHPVRFITFSYHETLKTTETCPVLPSTSRLDPGLPPVSPAPNRTSRVGDVEGTGSSQSPVAGPGKLGSGVGPSCLPEGASVWQRQEEGGALRKSLCLGCSCSSVAGQLRLQERTATGPEPLP